MFVIPGLTGNLDASTPAPLLGLVPQLTFQNTTKQKSCAISQKNPISWQKMNFGFCRLTGTPNTPNSLRTNQSGNLSINQRSIF